MSLNIILDGKRLKAGDETLIFGFKLGRKT